MEDGVEGMGEVRGRGEGGGEEVGKGRRGK